MNRVLNVFSIIIGGLCSVIALAAPSISPREAYTAVISGVATLVDVREESEINETGIAQPAIWLATSEIQARSGAYQDAVQTWPRGKDVIFYCRSGARAGKAADHFSGIGFRTFNMGSFQAWKDAGLPVK